MVAFAVAVLWSVEHRGRRIKGQQGQGRLIWDIDGHDPCPVRGKPLHLLRRGRGEGGTVRLRQQRIRQITPQKIVVILNIGAQHGIARQDRHRARAEEAAIALTIARAARFTVAVHIQTRRPSRIRGQRETVGVSGASLAKPVRQSAKRCAAKIVIHPLQHDDIGSNIRQQARHSGSLRVRPFGNVAQQQTRSGPR